MKKEYYIGLDVHKRQTTYTVKDWDGVTVASGKTATVFSDINNEIGKYMQDGIVAVEACTNYYHLYRSMKDNNINVKVANVIQLRKVIGKNDRVDSARLADMLRLKTMPESFIPSVEIQGLRNLISLYHNMIEENVRVQNKILSYLDMNGIRIPVKTSFSKNWFLHFDEYLKKNGDITLKYMIESFKDHLSRINKLKLEMNCYIQKNFKQEYELLKSVPGIGNIISAYLVAEICPIERFENNKKLRRYAGVVPIREQSDKKIYATYLPKHASRRLLRYALVLSANCAIKSENRLKAYYQKKKKGSVHGKAIMCVSSSICDIVYKVLKTKQAYGLSCST